MANFFYEGANLQRNAETPIWRWRIKNTELKNHYLSREFRVKLHVKTDIALIASRFARYRFSRAI